MPSSSFPGDAGQLVLRGIHRSFFLFQNVSFPSFPQQPDVLFLLYHPRNFPLFTFKKTLRRWNWGACCLNHGRLLPLFLTLFFPRSCPGTLSPFPRQLKQIFPYPPLTEYFFFSKSRFLTPFHHEGVLFFPFLCAPAEVWRGRCSPPIMFFFPPRASFDSLLPGRRPFSFSTVRSYVPPPCAPSFRSLFMLSFRDGEDSGFFGPDFFIQKRHIFVVIPPTNTRPAGRESFSPTSPFIVFPSYSMGASRVFLPQM